MTVILLALADPCPIGLAQTAEKTAQPGATADAAVEAPTSDLERLFRVLVSKHRRRLPRAPAPGDRVTVIPLAGGVVTGVVRAATASRLQLETEHGRLWVTAQSVAPESLPKLFPDRAALFSALRDFDLLKKERVAGVIDGGWNTQVPSSTKAGTTGPNPGTSLSTVENTEIAAADRSPLPTKTRVTEPAAPVVFDVASAKSPENLKPAVAAFGQWLGFQQRRVGGRLATAVHAKRQGTAAVLYVRVAPEFQEQDYHIRYQIAEGMWYFWAFRGVEMGAVSHPERAYLVLVSPGGRITGGSSSDAAAKLWVEEKPPQERTVKAESGGEPATPVVAESADAAVTKSAITAAGSNTVIPAPPVASAPVPPVSVPAPETTATVRAEMPTDKQALIAAYTGKAPLWLATPWTTDESRRLPIEVAAHGNAVLVLPAELPAGTLVLRVLLEYEPNIITRGRGGNPLSSYGWRWSRISPDGKETWVGQFFRIRLNDHLVWARWRTETQRVLTVLLPGDLRNEGREDRLVCENDAEVPLVINAMWVARPEPGAPVWVALGGMAWAERAETWRRMPVVAEDMPMPRPPAASAPKPQPVSGGPSPASATPPAVEATARKPSGDWPQAPLETAWRPVLDRVKAGGARLVVRCPVTDERDLDALVTAGTMFGGQVVAWQLRVTNGGLARSAVERLQRVCPGVQVALDTFPARGNMPDAAILTGGEGGGGYEVEAKVARARETLWRAGATGAVGRPWLVSAVTEACDLESQCRVGWVAAETTAAWLDAGGGPVTWWNGADRETGLFPQEEDRPGDAWTLVRLLTGISGPNGDARAWTAGLLPADGDAGTTLARWVATIEPTGRVNVLLFGGDDAGREFLLTVPVPRRTGNWRAVIEAARQSPKDPPMRQKTQRREVEVLNVRGGDTSLVRLKLKLETMMQISLSPPENRATKDSEDRKPDVSRVPLPLERRRSAPFQPRDVWRIEEAGELPGSAEWRMPGLPANGPWQLPTALSREARLENRPATPGQIGRVTNVAPYEPTSWFVTFGASDKHPDEPLGVAFPLAAESWLDSKTVRFWVRPSPQVTEPRKGDKPRNVAVRVGAAGLSVIWLKPQVWTRVEAPLARLMPANSGRPRQLRILPGLDPTASAHDTVLEINGLHLAGPQSPQGTPLVPGVLRELPPHKDAPPGPARLLAEMEETPGSAAVFLESRLSGARAVKSLRECLFGLEAAYVPETRLVRVTATVWPVKSAPEATKSLAATGDDRLMKRWQAGDHALLLLELTAPSSEVTPAAVRPDATKPVREKAKK